MKYEKPTKLSLRSHPEFSEWRGQERIAEDPSILGLGDPDGTHLKEVEIHSDTVSATKKDETPSQLSAALKQGMKSKWWCSAPGR